MVERTDRTYSTWLGMRDRCTNPNNPRWTSYGGRGITLCDSWHSFSNFLRDMGPRPENTTLDRIDNNGNYRLDNCRWATAREQQNNMKSNKLITYNGSTKTLIQWARDLNINESTLAKRLSRGWSIKRALTTKTENSK